MARLANVTAEIGLQSDKDATAVSLEQKYSTNERTASVGGTLHR